MMPAGARIWLVTGVTDMRKGMDTLCALVQTALSDNPLSGQVFIFRGRRGNKVKVLWQEPEGLCLYCKRLGRGHFVWPRVANGTVLLTSAQLSMLLEGIEWRRPERTAPREIDPKPPTLAA